MKKEESRTSETMQFGADLAGEGVAAKGSDVTRRGFLGGMGAMMAAAAAMAAGVSTAHADESEETSAEDVAEEAVDAVAAADESAVEGDADEAAEAESTAGTFANYPTIESTTGWTGTPEDVLALGVSTMPLDDLNQYRQAYVDAQTEYTCEDGTVIPLPYVKMYALIHTYGMGCGGTPRDTSFSTMMDVFTEEQAEAYVELPMGVDFTAYEAAEKMGITVDEAEELCEKFASEGFLCAFDSNRGRCYHQLAFFQGVTEYGFTKAVESDYSVGNMTPGENFQNGTGSDFATTGTPTFYVAPVDASVTSDGTILPFDDLKEKIRHANTACVSPCLCRYGTLLRTYGLENLPSLDDFKTGEYEDYFSDLCDQRVETCIQTGDEAAYWIEMGWGRQITGEQAAEYLQRSVDDGFILETTFGKNSDTICSCHVDSCGIIKNWLAVGEASDIAACDSFKQISHYTLEVDTEKCIGCGTCVDRCPLRIITINDEGWAEAGEYCFRCGQCCYVCPQDARHLVQRDESELAPLPQDMLEDSNVKAAYRFETGLIEFPATSGATETSEA